MPSRRTFRHANARNNRLYAGTMRRDSAEQVGVKMEHGVRGGVLALVLLPILWIADAQLLDHALFRQLYAWGKDAVGFGATAAKKLVGVDRAADAWPTGQESVSQDFAAARLALSLPGPEPFAAPEVAAALQLTDPQRAKLHELIEATVAALRSIDEKWQKESRHSQARKRNMLLQAARNEALQMLTPAQRAQWRAS